MQNRAWIEKHYCGVGHLLHQKSEVLDHELVSLYS